MGTSSSNDRGIHVHVLTSPNPSGDTPPMVYIAWPNLSRVRRGEKGVAELYFKYSLGSRSKIWYGNSQTDVDLLEDVCHAANGTSVQHRLPAERQVRFRKAKHRIYSTPCSSVHLGGIIVSQALQTLLTLGKVSEIPPLRQLGEPFPGCVGKSYCCSWLETDYIGAGTWEHTSLPRTRE